VAPFIAEANSKVFREHPDWFMKGDDGKPLPANRVTFGGWRRGPWYALDGTNPAVQKHLEQVFRTMRQEWGCTYFKLDANFWGAMHTGKLHDPKATRVEAYRRGMEAVLRGAGDSFILGCNHPLWPSLGLVDGSRSSGDITRSWADIAGTGRENLARNWQNGRLWWNDPDCLVLTGKLTTDEFQYHATTVRASGGLILSGDDLTKLPADRVKILSRLVPATGRAARFDDESLRVGRATYPKHIEISAFNRENHPQDITIAFDKPLDLVDFWTGEVIGQQLKELVLKNMPAHSARLLIGK
jgi:alpha-galactosidase